MVNPLHASKLLELIRELDLTALQGAAAGRFHLLIGGDPALARALAETLSETPERTGVHPWLSLAGDTSAAAPTPPPDLVLAVTAGTGEGVLEDAREDAHARLRAPAHAPLLRVCVGVAGLSEVGAELPRPGETARLLLTDLEPETVRAALPPALLRALPERLHLALARQLPAVRAAATRALVEETARANALYAASSSLVGIIPVLNLPVALADTVVLSKNQLLMTYKIALAAGKTGRAQEILTEAVGVLGGGLLFRQVARGLVGLVPVWGAVPKIAVAYAGTWVIGQAAERWATQGRVPTAAELRPLYTQALERGRALARGLLPTRRPRQQALPAPQPEGVSPTPSRVREADRTSALPAEAISAREGAEHKSVNEPTVRLTEDPLEG